jgi:hypothetical protein
LAALENALPGRFEWRHTGKLFMPYLTITEGRESLNWVRGESFKKTYRDLLEPLHHAGEISLEEHRIVDPSSPLFCAAIELARHSWETDGRTAIETMPRILEFFRELTRRAAKNGWLSLWLLKLNGSVIAMEYQLRFDGKVQMLCSGADPAYREFSPGRALSSAIFQALFEGGCVREYSIPPCFTRDTIWWANGSHQMVHLKLYRQSLYSRLLDRLDTLGVPGRRR